MSPRAWYVLDQIGHKIPFLRFGRIRYALCLKSQPYWDTVEDDGE